MCGQRSLRREASCARTQRGVLPDDLYVQGEPWPRAGRPFRYDRSKWTVTDDWPDHVPVNPAEIAVFEAWFGDCGFWRATTDDDEHYVYAVALC
jgi:hypothetical protein